MANLCRLRRYGDSSRGRRSISNTESLVMSGRDLKSFLNAHRHHNFDTRLRDGDNLVKRFIEGQKTSGKYRDVDYEQMKDLAAKYKESGLQSLRHIKELSKANKRSKEMSLIKQHSDLWIEECHNLNTSRNMVYVELETMKAKQLNSDDNELKRFFYEALMFEAQAEMDREVFHTNTIKPILQLVDDLKYWMRQLSLYNNSKHLFQHHDSVSEELELVKQQQSDLQLKLEEAYQDVNADVEIVDNNYFDVSSDDVKIEQGIPSCAKLLKCPYDELKVSVLNEFLVIDRRYISQLDKLKEKHSEQLNNPYGGWSADEWLKFTAIIAQYPAKLCNRRTLYIDRLLREFPHKSRAEIVSQEEFYSSMQYYKERRQLLMKSWQCEKEELVIKVQAIFTDAWEQHDSHEKLLSERLQQQKLCKKLHDKVVAWQQAKQEMLVLETIINEKLKEEEMIRKERNDHKRNQKRLQQKKMIELYHREQQTVRENQLRDEQKRLQELKDKLHLQALKDKERIEWREEKRLQKLEEKRILKDKVKEEEKEKEKRLNKLREKVQVDVEVDPCRVLKETQAYHAKIMSKDDSELELQTPLFQPYSFSADKIEADKRLKIASALAEAGLQHSDYARIILASVPPPKPPRPDQISTLFRE